MIEKITDEIFRETSEVSTEMNLREMEEELARLEEMLEADREHASRLEEIKAALEKTTLTDEEKGAMLSTFLSGGTGVSEDYINELREKIALLKSL